MKRLFLSLLILAAFAAGLFLYYSYGGSEDVDMSIEEEHWERIFAKAFEEVDCPEPRDPSTLPEGYYKGPIIDTHIHLQSLPDGEPGMPLDFYSGDNIGTKKSMEEWICMMDVEGTKSVFGFFAVWEPIIEESIDLVRQTMEKHPGRFVPFIMPPKGDIATVTAEELEEMLSLDSGLFKGYGEIGLYAPDAGVGSDLPPDSKRLTEIYPVIRNHKLIVYFHLGEGQKDAFKKVAEANPDVLFIFHGDQLKDCADCDGTHKEIAEILENNPNVYYGVDEIYGGDWLLEPGRSKDAFLENFVDYEPLLEKDLATFEDFIESHPDQVLFGTDRGVSASWDKDPDVALVLNNYARAFIGRLDPSVQEKFAYKNAERLIGGR